MDYHKSSETKKWDGNDTHVVDMKRCTRIRRSTTKWICDNRLSYEIRLLKNIVKNLETHSRDSNDIEIPENSSIFGKSVNNRKWENRKHHDTSPPTQVTRIKRIHTIEPFAGYEFVDWISKI